MAVTVNSGGVSGCGWTLNFRYVQTKFNKAFTVKNTKKKRSKEKLHEQ
jgi:hypothetical protein